jgi:molybdenum-dependent DNA-binding transcriptional regulator ModE
MNIALVGGGRAAVVLLDFFALQKDIKVIGISDINESAPGIKHAKNLGIPTTTDTKQLAQRHDVQTIIELTGNANVRSELLGILRPNQDFMSANCAKLTSDIIEAQSAHNAMTATTVSDQFHTSISRLSTAISNMDFAYKNIEKLLRETELVALNAKIECARAGQAGDAFAKVVERMHEMLSSIREAMDKISNASTESHDTLVKLKSAKDQLADEFKLSKAMSTLNK